VHISVTFTHVRGGMTVARLINAEVMGFFATPPEVVARIARRLRPPTGMGLWRLLDPCCGEGAAAAQLAQGVGGTVHVWGVELSPKRAEVAAQVLDRVQTTAWQSVRVSKESVSLLWLNPPYGAPRSIEL
jgi:predicted RNA methylase